MGLVGLTGKYIIRKADGSEVDPDAAYFVLRLDTDPLARSAALHYAKLVESTNPELASDLTKRCQRYAQKDEDKL